MKKERLDGGKQIVNYMNIDYLEAVKVDDGIELYYLFRPKIKTEKLKIKKVFNTFTDLSSYMTSLKFFKLGKYYINTFNFSIVDEGELHENNKKQNIILYMKSAQPLELTISKIEWNSFKNSRLI